MHLILAWTADELWGGQAENEVKFDFQLNLTLKVKVDHARKQ